MLLGLFMNTRDPIRASRFGVNALTVMVGGLIAVAVGNEMVIAHPHERASAALSALVYGGPKAHHARPSHEASYGNATGDIAPGAELPGLARVSPAIYNSRRDDRSACQALRSK